MKIFRIMFRRFKKRQRGKKKMNNKAYIFTVALLMIVGLIGLVSASVSMTPSSPVNGSQSYDRTPDFKFTMINNNATNSSCNLTIGGTKYKTGFYANNNTVTTVVPTSKLSDGTYNWTVVCLSTGDVDGTQVNGSVNYTITIGFFYQSTDVPKVAIDNIVGILSALFGLVSIIGIVLMYRYLKGKKAM
jgi:hypothetical protein